MDLYVKSYIVKKEKCRIFIVHGICEHSGRYKWLAKRLNHNKISVIVYDLRGHGKSAGKRGYIKNYQEHIKDLDDVIKKHDNKDVKRFLLGHSLGGLISHMYMVDNNQKIDGIITSGAPTNYIKDVRPLKFGIHKLLGFINVKNKFGKDALSKDIKVEEDYLNDPLVLKTFKLRLAGEMFVNGVKYLNRNIEKLNKPTLLLHGEEDKIVPKEHSERLYDLIKHDYKHLLIYENMYHEIFNEIEKEKVFSDVLSWINVIV